MRHRYAAYKRISDFASCALNRTISATWACRSQRLAMNSCMISHASQEEQDAAREEWFATRDKRIAEHEAKETRRKEQEKQHIEYWKDWRQFDPEKLNSQDSDKTK